MAKKEGWMLSKRGDPILGSKKEYRIFEFKEFKPLSAKRWQLFWRIRK